MEVDGYVRPGQAFAENMYLAGGVADPQVP